MPDRTLDPDETLHLAGMELRLVDLGDFECALDNTALHIPAADALIASDLIYNDCHPWLAEHGTRRWLQQLDAVEARFADCATIFAGHGAPGDRSLFAAQRDYITSFRTCVANLAQNGILTPDDTARVVDQTRLGRDDWPLEALISMNAAAVAQELAQDAAA